MHHGINSLVKLGVPEGTASLSESLSNAINQAISKAEPHLLRQVESLPADRILRIAFKRNMWRAEVVSSENHVLLATFKEGEVGVDQEGRLFLRAA